MGREEAVPGPLSDRALSERPTRNTLSSGMLTTRFLFQNFFPKNLAKKLGRVLQWRISGTARVRVVLRSTRPRSPVGEK